MQGVGSVVCGAWRGARRGRRGAAGVVWCAVPVSLYGYGMGGSGKTGGMSIERCRNILTRFPFRFSGTGGSRKTGGYFSQIRLRLFYRALTGFLICAMFSVFSCVAETPRGAVGRVTWFPLTGFSGKPCNPLPRAGEFLISVPVAVFAISCPATAFSCAGVKLPPFTISPCAAALPARN